MEEVLQWLSDKFSLQDSRRESWGRQNESLYNDKYGKNKQIETGM